MTYIPKILHYKPFYIQTSSDSLAVDTREWGLVVKTSPYRIFPKAKPPYKNDLKDENGDDEYNDKMFFEAFTLQVSFYVKAFESEDQPAVNVLREQITSFFEKIKSGEFLIYDSYTGLGFQKVRYDSVDDSNIKFKTIGKWARVIFSMNFKINDPLTRIVLDQDGTLKQL